MELFPLPQMEFDLANISQQIFNKNYQRFTSKKAIAYRNS